jgi:LmbE family N-acetylglucosaminyl deacetylase
VLDIHDGELEPTMENRRTITRLIRDWKADIVLGHRPNDYHPDHRAVGQLVQDASYMVTVPFFCPDTPHLERNPIFLSYEDRFTRPQPMRADIVVSIDDVVEKKLAATEAMPSQFYEGGANGGPELVPDDEAGKAKRKAEVRQGFERRFAGTAQRFRDKLRELYGAQRGDAIKYAEAFEISEYGRRPNAEEIRKLFPFFGGS